VVRFKGPFKHDTCSIVQDVRDRVTTAALATPLPDNSQVSCNARAKDLADIHCHAVPPLRLLRLHNAVRVSTDTAQGGGCTLL
jgi:hypothetical protein